MHFSRLLFAGVVCLAVPTSQAADPRSIRGLWLMGQSLCEGAESLPLVTTQPSTSGALMFQRGVRTWTYGDHHADPGKRPDSQFGFLPLRPAAIGGLGETMANGLADHLQRAIGTREKRSTPSFLVTYAGQGGRTIGELSSADEAPDPRTPDVKRKGGGYYKTSLDDARRATKQARAQGGDFSIAALVWMQGEANGGPTGGIVPHRWEAEMPRPAGQEWYSGQLIAYHRQWSKDLCQITGQRGEIPMFTYQTLGPAGEAQLMATDRDPNLYMVGPHYVVPSAINSLRDNGLHGASIHLSADGERWFGEQVAKVIHRVTVEGEKWQPLRPRRAVIEPSRLSILVEMHVPRPPLVLDEQFLPRAEVAIKDFFTVLDGFRVSSATGAVPLLKKVDVATPTALRLHLAAPLPEKTPYQLSYGYSQAGEIGTVASVQPGATAQGQPMSEIHIAGDLRARLKSLMDEGAFYVVNTAVGAEYAQTTVRSVQYEAGFTVLRFEDRDLRNKVPFVAGQQLVVLRPFPYGNVRDLDAEPSVYKFTDASYGTRAGQPYPLWNWCVSFSGFPVEEK